MKKTKRTTKRVKRALLEKAPVEVSAAPVTVNRVTCDGSLPGGFRVTPVPVQPGERI